MPVLFCANKKIQKLLIWGWQTQQALFTRSRDIYGAISLGTRLRQNAIYCGVRRSILIRTIDFFGRNLRRFVGWSVGLSYGNDPKNGSSVAKL
jgi:hypothetical protein